MDRRSFFKTVAAASATALATGRSEARSPAEVTDGLAVLVDTTRCGGCRYCELVCAETNGLPLPDIDDESALDTERSTSETQWSVVNRYETEAGEVFAKKQCMHCLQPACAAACLTKAMLKNPEGPVVWRENKCMGCRFCMISCPFDVPKFEYHSAVPEIHKCVMCWERLQEGQLPACVENCPNEALAFGKRSEMIAEARRRIHEDPQGYVPHIYGEHEVGGTSFLYLAAVPFEQLGFRTDLGTTAYPTYTEDFLYGVPVVLTVLPAFLLALSNATKREADGPANEG